MGRVTSGIRSWGKRQGAETTSHRPLITVCRSQATFHIEHKSRTVVFRLQFTSCNPQSPGHCPLTTGCSQVWIVFHKAELAHEHTDCCKVNDQLTAVSSYMLPPLSVCLSDSLSSIALLFWSISPSPPCYSPSLLLFLFSDSSSVPHPFVHLSLSLCSLSVFLPCYSPLFRIAQDIFHRSVTLPLSVSDSHPSPSSRRHKAGLVDHQY